MMVSYGPRIGPKVFFAHIPVVQPDDEQVQINFSYPEEDFQQQELVVNQREYQENNQLHQAINLTLEEESDSKKASTIMMPYQNIVEEIMSDYNQYIKLDSSWKAVHDDKDFKTHIRQFQDRGLYITRGEIVIQRSPETVLEFIAEIKNKKVYQGNYSFSELVDSFSDDRKIYHSRYLGAIGFADRDNVTFQDVIRRDGSYYFVQKSVTSDKCPEQKGVVRAFLHFSIVYIEPVVGMSDSLDAHGGCKLTYLEMSDPGGELPNWVKQRVAKDNGTALKTIKKHLEKKK